MKHLLIPFTFLFAATFLFTACSDTEDPCIESTWYEDADGDGLGNATVSQTACEQPSGYVSDNTDPDDDDNGENTSGSTDVVIEVDADLFLTDGTDFTISIVDCTLSDGTVTKCYQVVTNGFPTDHDMGPWCPENISDGADVGGIWLEGGEVHDVDGAFIENMATFYGDDTWLMYDVDGNIFRTETKEDCENAANPQVGEEYKNFCVECLPSFITNITNTYTIPVTPE